MPPYTRPPPVPRAPPPFTFQGLLVRELPKELEFRETMDESKSMFNDESEEQVIVGAPAVATLATEAGAKETHALYAPVFSRAFVYGIRPDRSYHPALPARVRHASWSIPMWISHQPLTQSQWLAAFVDDGKVPVHHHSAMRAGVVAACKSNTKTATAADLREAYTAQGGEFVAWVNRQHIEALTSDEGKKPPPPVVLILYADCYGQLFSCLPRTAWEAVLMRLSLRQVKAFAAALCRDFTIPYVRERWKAELPGIRPTPRPFSHFCQWAMGQAGAAPAPEIWDTDDAKLRAAVVHVYTAFAESAMNTGSTIATTSDLIGACGAHMGALVTALGGNQGVAVAGMRDAALGALCKDIGGVHAREDGRFQLAKLARGERRLAEVLHAQIHDELNVPESVLCMAELHADTRGFHELQREALVHALTDRLVIITGEGGTGKTEVVSALAAVLPADSVMLCAPTGASADVLAQRARLPARTIDSMVARARLTEDALGFIAVAREEGLAAAVAKFEKNPKLRDYERAWKARNLVVDEMSLVSPSKLRKLVERYTAFDGIDRVVIMGDANQLPSVEPGSLARDLLAAYPGHVVRLTKNFRAGTTDIPKISQWVLRGDTQVLSHRSGTFRILSAGDGFNTDELRDPHCFQNLAALHRIVDAYIRERGLDVEDIMGIAFTRIEAEMLNLVLQRIRHGRTRFAYDQSIVYPGDRVMITSNTHMRNRLVPTTFEPGAFREMYNGTYYRVLGIRDVDASDTTVGTPSASDAPLDAGLRRMLLLDRIRASGELWNEPLLALLPNLQRAGLRAGYACTTHVAEGSQAKAVIGIYLDMPRGRRYNTHQHAYTAVSRAEAEVLIITMGGYFANAVCNPGTRRITGVQDAVAAVAAAESRPETEETEPAAKRARASTPPASDI